MKQILLLVLLLPVSLFSQQDPKSLLKETTQAYLDANDLSMDVNVQTYSTSTGQGTLLGKGMIRKSGNNYYSKFLTDELIVNGNCTVVLDHNEKTITWYDANDKKKKGGKNQELPNMDSLAFQDSVAYKGLVNGQRHFVFYSRSAASAISMTEVYINDASRFIEKIVYYYRANNTDEAYDMFKVVIDYVNISTTPPSKTYFSESKYLTYSKGLPVLTSAYSGYQLNVAR